MHNAMERIEVFPMNQDSLTQKISHPDEKLDSWDVEVEYLFLFIFFFVCRILLKKKTKNKKQYKHSFLVLEEFLDWREAINQVNSFLDSFLSLILGPFGGLVLMIIPVLVFLLQN